MDKHIEVYNVRTDDLPRATKAMNCDRGSFFKSRVLEVRTGDEISLVVVELDGYYPYITNQWNFILSADEC
jgi:hypothetical protein